ncbi:hypothetical protein ABPG72_005757 [Tetrahymena utriculariae]
MPLKFEIKKKMKTRSERVKCVELHPELPWALVSLYSGNITIYDYSNETTVKTFENSVTPTRAAKFIVRKQWIVACSDDLCIRVYNYNTMEKIKSWEAHSDYIRTIEVHPSEPYILTSSDDATIKMWDFEKGFSLARTFEGHTHYVMKMCFNPRDTNLFASASLDKTIKVWSILSKSPNFSLVGHEQGVNSVDYHRGEHNYVISGGDDRLVKIWDCSTKQCIHTIEGHSQNISVALFHPELPIIITGSEDGFVKLWHSQTYRLETSLNYNLDRVWSVDICKDSSNMLAIGCDEGSVIVKIGSDEPVVSINNGKIIYAKNLELFTANLKSINIADKDAVVEGENIPSINSKDLGTADFYPTGLRHAPNGHSFAIFNDAEFSIYRSNNFKSIVHGNGSDLVFNTNGDYAVKDNFQVKAFDGSSNQQLFEFSTDYVVEGLYGGPLLGVKSSEFIIFYDWATAKIVRKIELSLKKLYWSSNDLVTLASADEFYVLQFKKDLIADIAEDESNEGIDEALEMLYEITESINSGIWIESLFFFTNGTGKISYSLAGKLFTFQHTDKKKFILGHIPTQDRLYMLDKFFNISSFDLPVKVAKYQSLIGDEQYDQAAELIKQIDVKYYDKLAKFLDQFDKKEMAFNIASDPEHKFELALLLGKLNEANLIAQETQSPSQLKQVGDLALFQGDLTRAINCFKQSEDINSLLLIYTSLGLREELEELGKKAEEQKRMNVAFQIYFSLADLDKCIDILVKSGRISEAAMFAKTYCPSRISELTKLWKEDLIKSHHQFAAQKIADPMDYIEDDSFSDLKILLKLEQFYKDQREKNKDIPSYSFDAYEQRLNVDLFSALKQDPTRNLAAVSLRPPNIPAENPYFNPNQEEEEEEEEEEEAQEGEGEEEEVEDEN